MAVSLIDRFVWSYQVTVDCQCNAIAGGADIVVTKVHAAPWNSTVLHTDAFAVSPRKAGWTGLVDQVAQGTHLRSAPVCNTSS